jgi:hypothetical protein
MGLTLQMVLYPSQSKHISIMRFKLYIQFTDEIQADGYHYCNVDPAGEMKISHRNGDAIFISGT